MSEARRCAEPEREKRRLAAATLRANGEADHDRGERERRRLAAATLRANGEAYHDRGEPWRERGGGSPPPR